MARYPDAEKVYEVARLFRERCLEGDRSFLWPDREIWTLENVTATWEVLNTANDEGRLKDRTNIPEVLVDQPEFMKLITVDVLAAGTLFPATAKQTVEQRFHVFDGFLNTPPVDEDTWAQLRAVFDVSATGGHGQFKGHNVQNFMSLLFGLAVLKRYPLGSTGRDLVVEEVLRGQTDFPIVWATNIWGLYHLFYPDTFVAVPSQQDRDRLIKTYADRLEGQSFANDFAALDYLTRQLPRPSDDIAFDFYHSSLLKQWKPKDKSLRESEVLDVTDQDGLNANGATDNEETSPDPNKNASALAAATHLTDETIRELEGLLTTKQQLIFEGPPGSDKTFVAEKFARWFTRQPLDDTPLNEQVEIVQFHQSYGYEDFVQGIRPVTEDGQLVYRVRDGIFLDLCDRATKNATRPFVLIIDEINRGNISRIFGELLMLLEYRDKSIRLPYGTGDQGKISIPSNLYIIGTMNSADRSLAQIDYALRRRFFFYRLLPVDVASQTAPVYERWLEQNISDSSRRTHLRDMFVRLNVDLTREVGSDDLQIGHSYFMDPGLTDPSVEQRIWRHAILPLLEEYLHHNKRRTDILATLTPSSMKPAAPSVPAPDPVDGLAVTDTGDV